MRCGPVLSTIVISFHAVALHAVEPMRFTFGKDATAPDSKRVSPETLYSREVGYGFERGGSIEMVKVCESEKPFYFSVALPEGNYRVTFTPGPVPTTVKAELRRLMVEGATGPRSFIVNVRTPRIETGDAVRLKDREKKTEAWNWDEKLTLEFNGAHPGVAALEVAPVEVPTLFLLGDSTVCDQPNEPYASWGQMLPRFFKPEIAVANHAESGESLRSSQHAKRLEKVASALKAGDTVLIQFGHNDEKEKGEGVGAFTTYKASLKEYVAEIREHGGEPVLVTSVHRRTFERDGKMRNSHGDYPEAVRGVAAEEHVPLIDLLGLSGTLYEALGPEKSGALFKTGDGTHHNNYGAYELARCVVEGMRAAKLPVTKFLADDVPKFDPAHPDSPEGLALPASPQSSDVTPLGN